MSNLPPPPPPGAPAPPPGPGAPPPPGPGYAPPPEPGYGPPPAYAPHGYAPPPGGFGAPGYAPVAQPGVPPGYVQKDKMVAGLLAILIGAFGIHNFYLGETGKGVAQLLITVLSCGFLAIVSSIWAIIEGVQILTGSINTDANGVPLKG
ncbi:TM2 domain-containing protein [Iamia sp.]|uniref:TM2 domain-containing protein n=1 Tax=Iamia sp. TaxID=2722710 RepID=UPI002C263F3C|nr:TM2 domain-containing protein [Iamia sp.]HXH57908.1 TM2 domain-containing protein [Iamia sp.]